jgi:hypothetical protein
MQKSRMQATHLLIFKEPNAGTEVMMNVKSLDFRKFCSNPGFSADELAS